MTDSTETAGLAPSLEQIAERLREDASDFRLRADDAGRLAGRMVEAAYAIDCCVTTPATDETSVERAVLRVEQAFDIRNEGGFTDANGRHAVPLVVVEYEDGARRGILLDTTHDGDAWVLFRDTKEVEIVKWRRLCVVPAIDEGSRPTFAAGIEGAEQVVSETYERLFAEANATRSGQLRELLFAKGNTAMELLAAIRQLKGGE